MKYAYMFLVISSCLMAALLLMCGMFHQTTGKGLPWGVAAPLLGICGVVGWFASGEVARLEDEDGLNRRSL